MNAKQKLFADAYVANRRNGTRAAIAAGYSAKSAKEQAYQMMQVPEIREYIDKEFAAIYERNKLSIDEAISILTDIGRTLPSDVFNEDGTLKEIHEIPEHAQHAITEISSKVVWEWDDLKEMKVARTVPTKLKLDGKHKALDMVLKHLGGYQVDNEQKKADPIVLNLNPLGEIAQDPPDDISQ